MTTDTTIRSLKSIADEIKRCAGWSPCDTTLRRYSRRHPEHNPLPLYPEIGDAMAISLEALHGWIERERVRRAKRTT